MKEMWRNYEGKIVVFAFDNVGRRSEAKVFSVKMDKSGFYSASAEGNSEWIDYGRLDQRDNAGCYHSTAAA